MRISWKLLNILLFKEIYITCSFFREKFSKKDILTKYVSILICWCRSSHPGMFLGKGVLKICSKFTGEHPCRKVISITLLCNFIEITLRHGCSPVNLLHIFTTPFRKNTSGWLLLLMESHPRCSGYIGWNLRLSRRTGSTKKWANEIDLW